MSNSKYPHDLFVDYEITNHNTCGNWICSFDEKIVDVGTINMIKTKIKESCNFNCSIENVRIKFFRWLD